jgi:murein DD-endopeptidase MepM/ murein hydrolase activator NlpD
VNVARGAEITNSALQSISQAQGVQNTETPGDDLFFAQNFSSNGAIEDPGQAIGSVLNNSGIITYTVQKGDTLASLASNFGVSTKSIISGNPQIQKKTVHNGQVLNILPAMSVMYQSQHGDTLASLASNFNLSQDKLVQFNQSVNFSSLAAGTSIIIPGGTNTAVLASKTNLPNFNSKFIMPAQGYDWGILHNYNAVDIANSCGTPVVASAAGVVVPDQTIPDVLGGWNGGYGHFVLIEHSFGYNVVTRYAHLQQVFVQLGDYVKQGQEIGLMGESGEATGCHVHFEIIGAQNPFVK